MALLVHDALARHPLLKSFPRNPQEWDRWIFELNKQAASLTQSNSFTPGWTGFSAAPSHDIAYVDAGDIILMWAISASAGISNATGFTITGIPADANPSATRVAMCECDDGTDGNVLAKAQINTDNTITLYKSVEVDSPGAGINFGASSWSATGSKGLALGWTIMYPK